MFMVSVVQEIAFGWRAMKPPFGPERRGVKGGCVPLFIVIRRGMLGVVVCPAYFFSRGLDLRWRLCSPVKVAMPKKKQLAGSGIGVEKRMVMVSPEFRRVQIYGLSLVSICRDSKVAQEEFSLEL